MESNRPLPPDVRTVVEAARSDPGKRAMKQVSEHELPDELEGLIDRYLPMRGSRDRFIWKWVHELAPEFTFPFVQSEYEEDVRTIKTGATLFLTLLDDVVEKEGDIATFREARKVPFPNQHVEYGRDAVDYDYVEFTESVWRWVAERLGTAPHYDEYADLFRYDLRQSIGAIEYSSLADDQLRFTLLDEHTRRESHNMLMFPYSDIDLMYGAELRSQEIATIREAVWHAQLMARIGNWISTWERELRENDYSSGIVVYALQEGIIAPEDLERIDQEDGSAHEHVVARIREAGVEEYFLGRWHDNYHELAAVNRELETIDLLPYVEGMREVLLYHLASRGEK
jgi:hypothetical protein